MNISTNHRSPIHPRGSSAALAVSTDMAAAVDDPKISAQEVAGQTLDAIEQGRPEVLTDDWTRHVKNSVATDEDSLYPAVQRSWDAGESPWKH